MTRLSTVYYSGVETPIGAITIARTNKGVCWLDFARGENSVRNLERWTRKHFLTNHIQLDDTALQDVKEQLEAYFAGKRKDFSCEIDVLGTPFQKLVWNALLNIPYGEVRSYKDIAFEIGAPKAVRAVGGANNKNNLPIIVPCHRVIGSNGSLVGYGGGLQIKEFLLGLEGYQSMHKKKA